MNMRARVLQYTAQQELRARAVGVAYSNDWHLQLSVNLEKQTVQVRSTDAAVIWRLTKLDEQMVAEWEKKKRKIGGQSKSSWKAALGLSVATRPYTGDI